MEAKLERRKFVHVVATVDLGTTAGEIRYVNPATTGITSQEPGHPDVEMSVEDVSGAESKRWHPVVRFASPEGGARPKVGLIQEDIPYEPGMKVVHLYVNGSEVAKYEAGAPPAANANAAAGAAPGVQPLALEPADASRPNRRRLSLSGAPPARGGVTYTVQVKPEGSDAWQTIAVGRSTPDSEIDRNQFPGARNVDVRVLRTTGFDERVVAQEKFDLGN